MRRRRDVWIGCAVAVLGLGIIAPLLTAYNMQPKAVWSIGLSPFPRSWEEYLLVNVTGLLFAPVLMVMLWPRLHLSQFGMRHPVGRANLIALLLYLVMLPLLVIASRMSVFQNYYPMQTLAAYNLHYFIYFELTYGFYLWCWEFFFRGFLTFGLARAIGFTYAIIAQAAAFGLMHIGKPWPEMAGSFIAGLVLGWLAVRLRSFWPGFGAHWAVAVTFDVLIIHARGGIF